MSISTPIHDFLGAYSAENPVRCHMPGGKRNDFDITEIDGADSLYESTGIIRSSEENASKLFGSASTLFSCGGSTLAIQTMLGLAKAAYPKKNRVAASRFCHRSLVSACALLGLEIDWIAADSFLSCNVSVKSAEEKINDRTLCLFVQSIDYYGGECDIADLSLLCRARKIPLLVDNAHGAYLVFTPFHPLKQGADMTADSAHKTLPCLTGGAYLHISKNASKAFSGFSERAKELMALFGSSSPSYLILDSLDLCNRHISEEKERAEQVFAEVKKLKTSLMSVGYKLRKSDLLRITIDACKYGYSGTQLSSLLRQNGVSAELADGGYVVLLFSTGQNLTDFPRILEAARKIARKPAIERSEPVFAPPTAVLSPRDALFSHSEEIPLSEAEGRVCASISCPCPPCVPLIMPGELFTASAVELMKAYGVEKVRVVCR